MVPFRHALLFAFGLVALYASPAKADNTCPPGWAGTITVPGGKQKCYNGFPTGPVIPDKPAASEDAAPSDGASADDKKYAKCVAQFGAAGCESLKPKSSAGQSSGPRQVTIVKTGDQKQDQKQGQKQDQKQDQKQGQKNSASAFNWQRMYRTSTSPLLTRSVIPGIGFLNAVGVSLVAEFGYIGQISGPEGRYRGTVDAPTTALNAPIPNGELISYSHNITGAVGACFMPFYLGACATFGAMGSVGLPYKLVNFKFDGAVVGVIPGTPILLQAGYSLLRRTESTTVHTGMPADPMNPMAPADPDRTASAGVNHHGGFLRAALEPLPRTYFYIEYRGYNMQEGEHDAPLTVRQNGTNNFWGVGMFTAL
jgi:hypothetical protein